MGKCCQMNGPLVGKVCVKCELDPSSYGPPASHSLALASKFQQACKLGNDAFLLHIEMGRFVKHDKPIMGLVNMNRKGA